MRIQLRCFRYGAYSGFPFLPARVCLFLLCVCGMMVIASRMGVRPSPKTLYGVSAFEALGREIKKEDFEIDKIAQENSVKHSRSDSELAKKEQLNPNFDFIISPLEVCANDSDIDLVIVVISDPNNFQRRSAIRNTWGSIIKSLQSKLVFLVAGSVSYSLQSELDRESASRRDIIQVFPTEADDNPSLASIAMLQWLNKHCDTSEFYMKTTDDTYVVVENAIPIASAWSGSNGRFFLCHVTEPEPIKNQSINSQPIGSSKFKGKIHRHCTGAAYIFSKDILQELYQSSLLTRIDRDESLFITGLAAETILTNHVHDMGFSDEPRTPSGCKYKEVIVGHHVSIKDMYNIFADMNIKEMNC